MLYCTEMDKLNIPSNWEFKPFDLKLINNLTRNHPYQKTMFLVYKYYASYDDEVEGDILDEINYFGFLDRYFRYGITFGNEDIYPKKRILYEKENFVKFDFGIKFEDGNIFPELLYVYEYFDRNQPVSYILKNSYDLEQLLYNSSK